jgi:hypothetical protein
VLTGQFNITFETKRCIIKFDNAVAHLLELNLKQMAQLIGFEDTLGLEVGADRFIHGTLTRQSSSGGIAHPILLMNQPEQGITAALGCSGNNVAIVEPNVVAGGFAIDGVDRQTAGQPGPIDELKNLITRQFGEATCDFHGNAT